MIDSEVPTMSLVAVGEMDMIAVFLSSMGLLKYIEDASNFFE